MTRSRIRAVLFDLDGTLIDTEPAAVRVLEQCFREWGLCADSEDARYITGRTWQKAFDHLEAKYPLPLPRQELEQSVLSRYRAAIEEELVTVGGAVEAVRSLARSGKFRIGLVSGSNRSEILWATQKLQIQSHFEVILGAEDYRESKPSPEGFLKAMETLGVTGSETLIFEDSHAGLSSARAAGAWAVAIRCTNHFGHDLSQAHFQIHDLSDVDPEWVEGFFQRVKA